MLDKSSETYGAPQKNLDCLDAGDCASAERVTTRSEEQSLAKLAPRIADFDLAEALIRRAG